MVSQVVASNAVSVTMKFLTCLSALNAPEFWNLDPDLPDGYLFSLFNQKHIFHEIDHLLHSASNWPVVLEKNRISVRSKDVRKFGRKLFVTQATLPATPEQLGEVFWTHTEKITNWNPDAVAVEIVKNFSGDSRVTWQVTRSKISGWIAPRDFVNLNFLRRVPLDHRLTSEKNLTRIFQSGKKVSPNKYAVEVIYTGTSWPSRPITKKHIRGRNGPSAMRFVPIPGKKPGEIYSSLVWLFNSDVNLSSFATLFMNQVVPPTLVEYVEFLRQHVEKAYDPSKIDEIIVT